MIQATLMWRSTVLSLPPQLVFPGQTDSDQKYKLKENTIMQRFFEGSAVLKYSETGVFFLFGDTTFCIYIIPY